ncbi:VOC family protein [Rubrolithibacter danxiaensis]|uniref:VOC family protein n=1 Tax=Rubrolithibacter danxiaensis TaxID=3390805 RepID=UPI003BF7939F
MEVNQKVKPLRTFIGAKDYEVSKSFYRDLGFQEIAISERMSLFKIGEQCFYLQDYYVKEWVDNTMLLLEVDDADSYWDFLQQLELDKKYDNVRLIPVQQNDWGKECLLIDPSGVLWHFAEFF